VTVKELSVTTHQVLTEDDVAISFDLYRGDSKDFVLIICPGFFQSKETKTFRQMSEDLTDGQDVICMDFRGHGKSGGLFTFSALEHKDIAAVVVFAKERYRRVGILGFSLGSASAISYAAHQHTVQRLILVSAPSSFEEIEYKFWTPEAIRTGIRGLEPGAGCRPGNLWLKKERPSENIRKITGIPIVFIHGNHDPIVSHHHSERLYQMAHEPKKLIIVERGGHAEELYRVAPGEFISMVTAITAKFLPLSEL